MSSLRSSQRQFIRSLSKGSAGGGERGGGGQGQNPDGDDRRLSRRGDHHGDRGSPGSPGMSTSPDLQRHSAGASGGRTPRGKLSSLIAPSLLENQVSDGGGVVDDSALFRTLAPGSTMTLGGQRSQRGGHRFSERLHSTVGADGRQDFRGYLAEAQKFHDRLHREKIRADKDVRELLSKSRQASVHVTSPRQTPAPSRRGEGKHCDTAADKKTFEWYAMLFLETPCDSLDEELKSFIEKGLYMVASSSSSEASSMASVYGAAQSAAGEKHTGSRSSGEFFSHASDDVDKSIDDFEILEPLSRGAYGRIFLARDLSTDEYVAIKVMRKSELVRKNRVDFIIAEQQIMANVAKEALPFVVSLKSSFQSKRYLFLCMEYCPGGDMLSLLQEMGVLDEDVARHYLAEITLALGALHALGVVHRDIKPDNICIDKRGHVKLTDFGLSFAGVGEGGERAAQDADSESVRVSGRLSPAQKASENGKGAAGCIAREGKEGGSGDVDNLNSSTASANSLDFRKIGPGTPDYMAPEILLGREHTYAVDWWSLGVVAYELMCGVPPFNAPTKEEVFKNALNGNIYWPTAEEIGSEEGLSEHAHGNVPFVPDIASAVDISYFSPDRRRNMGQVQEPETPLHRKVDHTGRFENFTFTVGESEKREQSSDVASHSGASRK
eukprot:g52.t1